MTAELYIKFVGLLLLSLHTTTAFVAPAVSSVRSPQSTTPLTQCEASTINTSFMWNAGLNFGKGEFKFYSNFEQWMAVFPEEDKKDFPEVFTLPNGVYEAQLLKPLGIVFEEIEIGEGLYVQDLVEGGNAEIEGTVKLGDILIGITAVKIVGAKYERRMIPCRSFDFDTMVGAVSSNDRKWGCGDVVLMFERPGEADRSQVKNFIDFFEPPVDNPWKQQQ
mmetsp:Transcript_7426/g.9659  ORF Transcript_7426/g.9659 Transcript_7426/m.9659 type:complete len:220 (-) Transcript_7426:213-872(-)|eukprot:CAMPEP_0198141222 /NCGR_PEP_ID=MMETSP1443-20131203/4258_1 /TAXON_ID=186043 /ORGANISM="Entomoneis sp., Strain CCMP2396" /LENGTH=219 /DNA_ID=CAMNT_0043803893 /DNA_START=145 /DNA_END=804 /DNA_ORIENTATION=-